MITCRLRECNFEKSSLAELGFDARSFAGDCEGCCVGGTWRGRAVSGDGVWRSGLAAVFEVIITGMFSKNLIHGTSLKLILLLIPLLPRSIIYEVLCGYGLICA